MSEDTQMLDVLMQAAQVTDDTRGLQAGGVMVWDARIKPDMTEQVLADAKARGAARVIANVRADGVDYCEQPGALLAAYAAATWPRQPEIMVGITGTSGKTSVAWFAQQLAQEAGYAAASLGTLGVVREDRVMDSFGYTSPTALALHPVLDELAQDGVTHAAMEVSSHALDLRRADGVRFAAAGFGNLSQDHLDYHGDMDTYMAVKMRLFTELLPEGKTGVVNVGRQELWPAAGILKQRGCGVLTVGQANAELVVRVEGVSAQGLEVSVRYGAVPVAVMLPLVGAFQADNVAMALGLWVAAGVSWDKLSAALPVLTSVPGRMEIIPNHDGQPTVVVDYAHKPEALDKALAALRPQTKGRLWVVFGCGGNRDAGKRPLMGGIAGKLADCVVVTDDNPRNEDAAAIREQIIAGVSRSEGVWNMGDRREAIAFAIEKAAADDVVLVAGKGHEEGQVIKGETHPFNDKAVVQEILNTEMSLRDGSRT